MDYFSQLDNPNHTFVIAEAGSNWKCGSYEDDLKQGIDLIKTAAKAGSDAVKFQTYRPESVYVKDAGKSKYLSKSGINEDVFQLFSKLSMPYEMIPELSACCKKYNICFMSTPFSVQDVDQIDPYVKIHKIASYEINHVRLIKAMISKNKPIILSTGASTLEEIDFAVNILKEKKDIKFALMQCTAKYPAPIDSMNLSVIPLLKKRYNIPIGLSDHSIDPIISPLIAIGMNATIIEKHFTLDRNLEGPDHQFALNPNELKLMVESIRMADKTKGNGKKEILDIEKELHQFATRSLQAIKNIKKGEILVEGENFDVLRPGNKKRGLDARKLDTVNGKKAINDISLGDGIEDFE
jgi:N,N'-diacetyllegionaminate synthase